MDSYLIPDLGNRLEAEITTFQAASVAFPYRSTNEILAEDAPFASRPVVDASIFQATRDGSDADCRCSFQDFDRLFEQIADPPPADVARPLPAQRRPAQRVVGSCPAAHNQALLGDPSTSGENARAAGRSSSRC